MSTNAVQPEIDALTLLKEAGTILDFEFKGHPSPRFEVVVLAIEWDEATNGWTKEGKAREAALDKAMNDLQWRFDDHVELDNEDGTERWIYKFHGEAKSTIPGGHYRCVDASGYDGEHWDIQPDGLGPCPGRIAGRRRGHPQDRDRAGRAPLHQPERSPLA
jgi:hypothetical protein